MAIRNVGMFSLFLISGLLKNGAIRFTKNAMSLLIDSLSGPSTHANSCIFYSSGFVNNVFGKAPSFLK